MYSRSVPSYLIKDSRNPAIKAHMASVHALEEKLGMAALVEEMVEIVEEVGAGEVGEEELVSSN